MIKVGKILEIREIFGGFFLILGGDFFWGFWILGSTRSSSEQLGVWVVCGLLGKGGA